MCPTIYCPTACRARPRSSAIIQPLMSIARAPWLANYDAGVPATLAPYPNRTILDYFSDQVRTRPDAAALLFKGATLSWAQLERDSDAFAAALAGLGVVR